MEYIRPEDLDYIMNKYHSQEKLNESFDSVHRGAHIFDRFIRRDEIFSPDTGMHGDDIYKGIREQDDDLKSAPHPIRKARALEFVLKNTRISCDPRDIFPAINMVDRPLNKTIIADWRKEVFSEIIPDIEEKRKYFEDSGIVTIWPDYDHSSPIWERLFSLGFAGILAESEEARDTLCNRSPEQDAFFEGIKITYTAILDFIGRLSKLAAATKGSEKLSVALKNIRSSAPASFYEALLVDYLYFMICEHIEGLQVRSLSNFDRDLQRFYQNDLASGKSETELRTELAYFFLQFTAIGNYWGQPVYLGGENADGSTVINELSYTFLDVYDKMNIYNPKLQIKLAKSTPKSFVTKALDMIRRGNNSIVFVCDATIRKSLINDGATEDEARLCQVTGCYEYCIQGIYGCGMNYLNLLKPLEYALHRGCDGVTGEFVGLESPDVSSFTTFDDFYSEYKRQLLHIIDLTVEITNGFEDYLSYINPQSMLSATFPKCLESGRDALSSGLSGLSVGFISDLADSLAMIKKHVFDRKELSLTELVGMLDKNFEGNEAFRRKLIFDRDKCGNNKELPDFFAVDITDFINNNISGRPNSPLRNGHWVCGFHVARMSYVQGSLTATSPNGRLIGEELSKNISASMGQSREGATAAILSATKIHASTFVGDACLDLGLHPTAVKGEDGLEAMYGLLTTFEQRGGHALHINVFDADTLRNAQKHPEKYGDLQIRVCGWNVLWNNISKEEQDGFIRQAEALA